MPAFLSTHALDLVLLLIGFALAYAAPVLVPYAASIAIGLQSTAPHSLTSDGDILLGLVMGLLTARWRGRRPELHIGNVAVIALLALCVAVIVSYLLHLKSGDAHDILQATQFFVSRSLLITAVVLLLGTDRRTTTAWLRAFGALALLLASGRLAEQAGWPVAAWLGPLHVSMLGDAGDPGSWNLLAVILAVGLVAVLGAAFSETHGVSDTISVGAAAVIALALGITASRTGAVVLVVTVAVLVLSTASIPRRLVVGCLLVLFVAGFLGPGLSVTQKPLLVSRGLGDSRIGTSEEPRLIALDPTASQPPPADLPPHLPGLIPDWSVVLDRTYYRLQDQVPASTIYAAGNRIEFVARSAGTNGDARLVVAVDGREVVRLAPSQLNPYFSWIEVEIPDGILKPDTSNQIQLSVAGKPDSGSNYFRVGGVNARADGYTARLWSGSGWLTEDISSDIGVQQGMALTFVNRQVPKLVGFAPTGGALIDPSIRDRFYLWQTALAIFNANPVAGTGFYTFGAVKSLYQPNAPVFFSYSNAHSNYMELLADLGVQGLLAFTVLLVLPAVLLARRRPLGSWSWQELVLLVGCADFALSSITQTWVADSRVYLIGWALALLTGAAVAFAPVPVGTQALATESSGTVPNSRSSPVDAVANPG